MNRLRPRTTMALMAIWLVRPRVWGFSINGNRIRATLSANTVGAGAMQAENKSWCYLVIGGSAWMRAGRRLERILGMDVGDIVRWWACATFRANPWARNEEHKEQDHKGDYRPLGAGRRSTSGGQGFEQTQTQATEDSSEKNPKPPGRRQSPSAPGARLHRSERGDGRDQHRSGHAQGSAMA